MKSTSGYYSGGYQGHQRKSTGRSGAFSFGSGGNIQLFAKREVVKPYLYDLDSHRIHKQVTDNVQNTFADKDPNLHQNLDKFLPRHLVNDLFSLYYNRSENIQFEGLNKTNKTKFKILESINNSLIKVITNGSQIGSYIFTQEISKFLYDKFLQLTPEQQQQLIKDLENTNQGSGNDGEEEQKNNQKKGQGKPDKKDQPNPQQNQNNKSQGQGQNGEEEQGMGSGSGEHGDEEQNGSQQVGGSIQSNDTSERNTKAGNQSTKDNVQGPAVNTNNKSKKDPTTQNDVDNMIDSLLNSKQSQKDLEKALKAAEDQIDKLKDAGVDFNTTEERPEEEQQEIIDNLNRLDELRSELRQLNVNKDTVLKAVDKMLSSSNNYFSKKCKTKEVELFEADEILDINGIEYLHPIFKKSRLTDLSITERKYIGKFDLYVDCSGSMDASSGFGRVSRIQLAKALAMQMKELGILGDLYEFEDRPKRIKNTEISILLMDARGGTNIENVLQNIAKTGNNSVILTDGESQVSTYTHKAFFIGVGTDFSYFAAEDRYSQSKNKDGLDCGQQLVDNGQCLMYDGSKFIIRTLKK